MNKNDCHVEMITAVAKALGEDLLKQVAFVGGSTTGLLLTDEFSKEAVRYTNDVDLIINVIGYPQWAIFQDQLRKKGFKEALDEEVICRMKLGELSVDFMPDDAAILGFSNRWYSVALETAVDYELDKSITIRLLQPIYFLATKLVAYNGRGNDDPLVSRDMEDILNLIDGREELLKELKAANTELKRFIGEQFQLLLEHQDFDYAVKATANGDSSREEIIFDRIDSLAALTNY